MKLYYSLIFLTVLISLPLVLSQVENIGIYNQGDCVILPQVCANCTSVNITQILYPNSTNALDTEVKMNRQDSKFTYEFCQTNFIGEYIITGIGDIDGVEEVFSYGMKIKRGGSFGLDLNSGYGILAIVIMIGIILLLMYFNQIQASAFVCIATGFIMLLNGGNIIVSIIFAGFGLALASYKM